MGFEEALNAVELLRIAGASFAKKRVPAILGHAFDHLQEDRSVGSGLWRHCLFAYTSAKRVYRQQRILSKFIPGFFEILGDSWKIDPRPHLGGLRSVAKCIVQDGAGIEPVSIGL